MKKYALIFLLALLTAIPLMGQGSVTGNEQTIIYSGNNAAITPPNTPVTNFNTGSGLNTFILSIANPTVAIRVYITNNTANACSTGLTLQMFSSTDPQVTSFNNSLPNWQTVLLQTPTGGLANLASISVPASGAAYVTSTAIVAPRVAIQLVNAPAGSCATTNVEVTAVITQVAVSAPLISTNGPNPLNSGNNVQGVAGVGANATTINPIPIAGAQLASNGAFTNAGLDTFTIPTSCVPNTTGGGGSVFIACGIIPALTQNVPELALIAVDGQASDIGSSSYNANWTCLPSINCTSANQNILTSASTSAGLSFVRHYGNAGAAVATGASIILTFKANGVSTSSGLVGSPIAQTVVAGNPLVFVLFCNTGPCAVTSISDTLSNSWGRVTGTSSFPGGLLNSGGLDVWITTNVTNGGGDSVSWTQTGGTGGGILVQLSGASPSNLVQSSTLMQVDPTGGLVTRPDAQFPNQFVCNVTLSTNTTTQCQAANTQTINGQTLRPYITDFQINTTAAGTATTIQLKYGTGSNCGTGTTNLSAILYPNTTTGITNIINVRTPFIAGQNTAICATQAGTTPGTSVIEIHGYYAP